LMGGSILMEMQQESTGMMMNGSQFGNKNKLKKDLTRRGIFETLLALWKLNHSKSRSRNQKRGVAQSLQTESSKTKPNTIANRSTKEDTNYERCRKSRK
jgi:hypothetical protein